MITTPTYKFKKRQLTDAPNIEVGEDNWDIVETELSKKVDKTQIKNTLTETTTGNVLDATQGKILNDKINGKADSSHTHSSYVNQNAFSNIKVGTSTISADTTTDTLEIIAGKNVTLTANETNDSITITARDTVYVHPNNTSTRHVTDSQISTWTAKETTSGAQSKADKALSDAKIYTDEKIASLVSSAPETLDTLNELANALGNDPNFATTVSNQIRNKVDKVSGKGLSTNDYTTTEKNKLAGIEASANNYVHPSTHDAFMITESTSKRFVTDTEKATWNAKASTSVASSSANGLMSSTDKSKLDGITSSATKVENSATNGNIKINGVEAIVYTHPTGTNPHGTTKADIGLGNVNNTSDLNKPISTATQTALNGKANSSHTHTIDNITDIAVGTCSTSATTVAKTVTVTNFTLRTGAIALIKFTYANTVANPTMNINSTGAKPIFYNGIAVPTDLINANDLVTMMYDGTNWVINGVLDYGTTTTASSYGGTASAGTSSKVAREDHKHALPALPTASTSTSGIVQLSSAVNSTSTTLGATARAVKTAYDLAKTKVGTSQIKNNLTETTTGNVLDATQGKVLNDKISVLNVDRGYLSSKNITDANEAIQNGIYKIRYDCLNLPEASSGSIDVSIYDTSIIFQKLINANMNTWVRIRKSSVWTDWKQIATTTHITGLNDKITILDGVGFKYNGNITTFSQINKTGYYTIFGCSDGTIPIQYGTLKAYLSGSEKTITAMGWYNNEIIQCFASYNNNTSKWTWQQIATTDSVKQLNNVSNFNTGNTTPKDYLNVMKPNGARTYNDLGISVNDGYWCNVFGINNYNGDTGVTELAFTDKGKIFFRTQVGVAKMENWNDTHWQQIATTTKTNILCTAKPGFTIHADKSYMINNVLHLNLIIVPSDGGNFPTTKSFSAVCTLPSNISKNGRRYALSCLGWTTTSNIPKEARVDAFVTSGLDIGVAMYSNINNANAVMISGEVVLE